MLIITSIIINSITRKSQVYKVGSSIHACVLVTQSCQTLCDPMNCSLPGFSVHGSLAGKNAGVCNHSLLPRDLPDPEMEPESPALQAVSLPSEPPGNASLITLFYSTSCRRWAGCSEFGVDWKRKRLRGAHTTDIFYITHWFVAFKLKETEAQIQWRGREQTQS